MVPKTIPHVVKRGIPPQGLKVGNSGALQYKLD